jgi:signal transduction histidine kinase
MARRHQRKRAVLFLAAVLLPSAVLVGTTLRLIRQQRELAVRRGQEERAQLALRLGQELRENLSRLTGEVAETPSFSADIQALSESEPALLTVASVTAAHLVYPWEGDQDPASALVPATVARYRGLLEQGEDVEYGPRDFPRAASLYAEAAGVLGDLDRGNEASGEDGDGRAAAVRHLLAEARVRQARALYRAGRLEEARSAYLRLAALPFSVRDQEGIPFSIYGLDGLCRAEAERGQILSLLEETLDDPSLLSLPALLAWRDVAREAATLVDADSSGGTLRVIEDTIASRTEILQALENLRQDFPALLAASRRGSGAAGDPNDPTWIPYGDRPWLVGIPDGRDGDAGQVAIVRPGVLLTSLGGPEPGVGNAGGHGTGPGDLAAALEKIRLLPAGENGGEFLGPALNGLRAAFPPDFPPPPDAGGVEGWFFRLLLPVILLFTGFTAYLAWRDVRRETEAARLRSQFVSSVTHELKTPLTSIRMFVETLRLGRHSSPEARQEYLDTVLHETERLSRLINNVLDFARIDRGEKTYHMAPTDLAAAAREAERAVAYPLAQGGYELVTNVDEDLPLVDADEDALTQALLNLLSNAIKFSEERSRIDLRVFREGNEVLLQVEDRGRGITPRDQQAIFRDFFRTAEAEREGIPGTGLGLPLVAHLAEAHRGRVEVESEVGRGSTFTIRIPVDGESPDEGDTP